MAFPKANTLTSLTKRLMRWSVNWKPFSARQSRVLNGLWQFVQSATISVSSPRKATELLPIRMEIHSLVLLSNAMSLIHLSTTSTWIPTLLFKALQDQFIIMSSRTMLMLVCRSIREWFISTVINICARQLRYPFVSSKEGYFELDKADNSRPCYLLRPFGIESC